ncbi:putative gustatory receptor 28a [Prorops nasuta]|uniref:putative gustatory receptor 28a n=1 Tax=Prorops nasuta TaxID=863751 RepID=UPI0034CE9F07
MQQSSNSSWKRWRPLKARNFDSLMRPIFFFSYLLGLFPYKIIIMKPFKIHFSKVDYIVSGVITMVYTIYVMVILYQVNFSGTLEFDSTPGLLQSNFYTILGFCSTITTFLFSTPRLHLLQSLSKVSARLPPEFFNRISQFVHAKDMFIFTFLVGQCPNVYSNDISRCLAKINWLYSTVVVFLMDSLYMNCVCVLKICYEYIGQNLTEVRGQLKGDKPHLLRRVYHEENNPLLLMQIRSSMRHHLEISASLVTLNDTFTLQLLITVTMTFIEVTFSLYFFLLHRRNEKGINLELQIWYSYFSTSILYYSIKFLLIIFVCEMSRAKALKLREIVYELILSTNDTSVRTELQLFSQQLMQLEDTFTAKGFNIDTSLLTMIIGSISTYLLILIQFLITSKPCET